MMDLSKIRTAKESVDGIKEMRKKVDEALEPTIKDARLLGAVYDSFRQFMSSRGWAMDAGNRKKFLFIVFYLFCPAVLIGESLPRGFRDRLRDLIGAKSASVVSNDVANLMFLYVHYSDFRKDVEDAYSFISESMDIA